MAQSSSSSDEKIDTFTGLPAFWPKPTPKPSMLWKDWMTRFYLAADLKDGCYTRALLDEPAEVTLEPAPKLEEASSSTEDPTATANRVARNDALLKKHAAVEAEHKKRGPKLAHGIYYHDVEVKIRARLFLALGNEGQRRFRMKFPRVEIHKITFRDFVKNLNEIFDAEVNTTYERLLLFTRNMKQGETMEHFHAALSEQAAKCNLGTLEEELIKDLFVAKMNDADLQRKFIMKKTEPKKVLEEIVLFERGTTTTQNFQKVHSHQIKTEPNFAIDSGSSRGRSNFRGRGRGRGSAPLSRDRDGKRSNQCNRCGKKWTPEH